MYGATLRRPTPYFWDQALLSKCVICILVCPCAIFEIVSCTMFRRGSYREREPSPELIEVAPGESEDLAPKKRPRTAKGSVAVSLGGVVLPAESTPVAPSHLPYTPPYTPPPSGDENEVSTGHAWGEHEKIALRAMLDSLEHIIMMIMDAIKSVACVGGRTLEDGQMLSSCSGRVQVVATEWDESKATPPAAPVMLQLFIK